VRQESLEKENDDLSQKPSTESRGYKPRPDKAGHQPEASLAWSEGDLGCEA
jgi:hypothetical protein